MHVGVQGIGTSKMELQFLTRHGVTHMDAQVDGNDAETLTRHRQEAADEGVSLEMIHYDPARSITLAQDPQRDRDIEEHQGHRSRRAGRPARHQLQLLRLVPHTEHARTRRQQLQHVRYSRAITKRSARPAPSVEMRALIGQGILERVIPVAEVNNVQLASHLDDPLALVLRGVERWNWPVFDGLKRFSELVDSPNHGFNFCCGVASEGLADPGRELYDIIRYFGERKKIFNIHYRNIRGGLHKFQEVWLDEGDLDIYEIARVLRDVEYPYMPMLTTRPAIPTIKPPKESPDASAMPGLFSLDTSSR